MPAFPCPPSPALSPAPQPGQGPHRAVLAVNPRRWPKQRVLTHPGPSVTFPLVRAARHRARLRFPELASAQAPHRGHHRCSRFPDGATRRRQPGQPGRRSSPSSPVLRQRPPGALGAWPRACSPAPRVTGAAWARPPPPPTPRRCGGCSPRPRRRRARAARPLVGALHLAADPHAPEINPFSICWPPPPAARRGRRPNAGCLSHGLPTAFTVWPACWARGVARSASRGTRTRWASAACCWPGADPHDGQALYRPVFDPGTTTWSCCSVRPGRRRRRPLAQAARRRA